MAKQNKKQFSLVGALMAAAALVVVTAVVALTPAQNLRYAAASVLPVDGPNCPGTWDETTLTCTLNSEATYTDQFRLTIDNSTLDCNGAAINVTGATEGVASVYATQRRNVSVKNCHISNDTQYGIYFLEVTEGLIDNNTITDTYGGGIYLAPNTARIEVSNNIIPDNPDTNGAAILILDSNVNHVHHNTIGDVNQTDPLLKYALSGIYLDGAANLNIIEYNTISTNIAGIYTGIIGPNNGNTFDHNVLENNTAYGMYFGQGEGMLVTNNRMCGNTDTDMFLGENVAAALFADYYENTGDTVHDNLGRTGFTFDYECYPTSCDDTVAYLEGLGYTADYIDGDIVVVYNEGTDHEVNVIFKTCNATAIENVLAHSAAMEHANPTSAIINSSVTDDENNYDEAQAAIVAVANSDSDNATISTNPTTGEVNVIASNSETGGVDFVAITESLRDENDITTLAQTMQGGIDGLGTQIVRLSMAHPTDNEALRATINTVDPTNGEVLKTSILALDTDSIYIPQYAIPAYQIISPMVRGVVDNDSTAVVAQLYHDDLSGDAGIELMDIAPDGSINSNKDIILATDSLLIPQFHEKYIPQFIGPVTKAAIDVRDDIRANVAYDPTLDNMDIEILHLDPLGLTINTNKVALDLSSLAIPQFIVDPRIPQFTEAAITGAGSVEDDTDSVVTYDAIDNDLDIAISKVSVVPINTNRVAYDIDTLLIPQFREKNIPQYLVAATIGTANVESDTDSVILYDAVTDYFNIEASRINPTSGEIIDTSNISIPQYAIPQFAIPQFRVFKDSVTGVIDAVIEEETAKTALVEVSDANPLPPKPQITFEAGDSYSAIIVIDENQVEDDLLAVIVRVAAEQSDVTDSTVLTRDAEYTNLLVDGNTTIKLENPLLERSLEAPYLYKVLSSLYSTVVSYDSVRATATADTLYISQLIFSVGAETYTVDGGPNVTADELAQSVYTLFDYNDLVVRCGVRGQENRACGENTEVSLHLKACADTWNNVPEDVLANCTSYGSFMEDPDVPSDNKFRYYAGSVPAGEYFLVAKDPDLLDPMGNPTLSSHPTVYVPEDTFANVIMHVKPDGKNQGMKSDKKSAASASLWVYQPTDVVWVNDVEYYPFYFESDANWTVDVCMAVPEGYQIIESQDCVQAFVAGEEKEVLFKVIEVGSIPYDSILDWEFALPDGTKIKEQTKIGVKLHPNLVKEKKLELLEKGYEIDEKGKIKKI